MFIKKVVCFLFVKIDYFVCLLYVPVSNMELSFFLWHDPKMAPRAKVVINQLKWENKLIYTGIKEMYKIKDKNDINDEKEDEVKEVDHNNSIKAGDWLGTDEINGLKRELKALKASLKRKQFTLKCSALFSVFLCFVPLILMFYHHLTSRILCLYNNAIKLM